MAAIFKRLVPGSALSTSTTTYYTAGVGTTAVVHKLSFINNDTSPRTVTAYFVPSGGSAGNTNIIVNQATLFPNETWSAPDAVNHIIESGGTIQAKISSGTSVTLIASGVEIS